MADKAQKKESGALANTFKNLLAGTVAGVAQVVTGYPLDTVKVRLQTQDHTNPRFSGALDCMQQTFKHEGLRGFFKGMSSPLVGVGAINALLFGAYGTASKSMSDSNVKAGKARQLSITQVYIAGSIAGVVNTILCSPIEMLKTQLQVQYNNSHEPTKYKGPWDLAKAIVRTEGITGLGRGFVATTYREGIANGAFYATFELAKRKFAQWQGVSTTQLNPIWLLLSGSLAGVGFWTSCYPLDVIKSKIQSDPFGGPRKYTGIIQTARIIIAEEGAAALFRGFSTCIARTIPAGGATFLAYELAMRALNRAM